MTPKPLPLSSPIIIHTCLLYIKINRDIVLVLEILSSIGEIVANLDIKTLLDQWKGIAKLLTKYSPYLKDRLNISQPQKFLVSCLEKKIVAITNEKVGYFSFIVYFHECNYYKK